MNECSDIYIVGMPVMYSGIFRLQNENMIESISKKLGNVQVLVFKKKVRGQILSIYLFIPLARAECNHSLPFSGASSISLCYVLFLATLLHQLFFHPLSPYLAIYFLVYLSVLLFPNSYTITFWEFYFLPF